MNLRCSHVALSSRPGGFSPALSSRPRALARVEGPCVSRTWTTRQAVNKKERRHFWRRFASASRFFKSARVLYLTSQSTQSFRDSARRAPATRQSATPAPPSPCPATAARADLPPPAKPLAPAH